MFVEGCGEHGVVAGWAAVREWSSLLRYLRVSAKSTLTIKPIKQITAKTTREFSTGQTLYFHIFILLLYRAYPLLNCVLIELPSMETKLQILWVLFDTLC